MGDDLRDEVLYGRDNEHVRIFISSRMNGTLTAERRAAFEAVGTVSGHKGWWWEDDAPMGVLHSENDCIAFARTSDGLVLLVAGELSDIVHAEYQAARKSGAERYIFIRDTDDLPSAVNDFIEAQRSETVTRNFNNVDELTTHIYKALNHSFIRALREQGLVRRSKLRSADD